MTVDVRNLPIGVELLAEGRFLDALAPLRRALSMGDKLALSRSFSADAKQDQFVLNADDKEVKGDGIDGRGEEIALAKFAAELFEIGSLAGRFNSFGNHFEVQVMREGHNEVCDFTAFDILLDAANEGAVDF